MEMFLGDGLVTFDGQVIEVFGAGEGSSGRLHLATLAYIELGERAGGLYIRPLTVWGTSPLTLGFPSDQRPVAEWIISEVERARTPERET